MPVLSWLAKRHDLDGDPEWQAARHVSDTGLPGAWVMPQYAGVMRHDDMTSDARGFGARLGSSRRVAGLSQEQLAERSGLSSRALRNLERGQTKWPHPDSVRRLADALDLHGQPRAEFIAAAGRRLAQGAPSAPAILYSGSAGSWPPVFQLPAAPADFTGRTAESGRVISAIMPRLDRPGVPLAVVSGPPGAGKTSLALHVAHTIRARFGDGQLWVHLAGASARPRDPVEVLGEFLRALGVPGAQIPSDLAGRAACYRSCLAGRKVLVVADDAADAAQVQPLVPETAGCAMVVTSRAQLEGLDRARLLPLDVMTTGDAVDMLATVVGDQRVAAEPAQAYRLAQACGALPLALRITGAKLATRPSWPLSVMVRKLTGAQGRLGELESADMSVRASIDSSYQSLPEPTRRAFGLLALLGPVDFAEWAVAALLGETSAADVISELADQSLLTPAGADRVGEPRYRLHDLLRDFAAERLADEQAVDKSKALKRVLDAWLQLSMMADARLPAEPYFPPPLACSPPAIVPPAVAERLTADPIAWFTAERVNLLAAVQQACESGHLDLARQLASHQAAFQHSQDRRDDTERQWRVIADSAGLSGDPAAAAARLRVAAAMVRSGQAASARPILDQTTETNDHSGEPGVLALALYWRAICALDLDDPVSARSAAARGVAVARRAGTRLAEYLNLSVLGQAFAKLGAAADAVRASESALAIASALGVESQELDALLSMGYTFVLTGRHQRAVNACLRAIELSVSLGDVCGEALAHGVLGDAYHGLGRYREAAASLHRALPVFRDRSARHFQAVCLLKLGYAYEAMDSREAVGYLAESLQIFRQLHLQGKVDRAQEALNRCKGSRLDGAVCSPP
jgi:tetratricopeptide (TPR) repeat protein/DNA-binding XRE family transcriptional regulator